MTPERSHESSADEVVDWEAKYNDLLRQTEPVIRAINTVVPQRYNGMHPNLLYLYDVAQAWRNFVVVGGEPEPAPIRRPRTGERVRHVRTGATGKLMSVERKKHRAPVKVLWDGKGRAAPSVGKGWLDDLAPEDE